MEPVMKVDSEIENICRTCMAQGENMQSLLARIDISESNFIYCDMIMACASVQVSYFLYHRRY